MLQEFIREIVVRIVQRRAVFSCAHSKHSAPEPLGKGAEVLAPFDADDARRSLEAAWRTGIRAVAIVFLHGYRFPEHERLAAALAKQIGFTQISTSHEVSPLMKLVGRGDTTVVDAYLSPILSRYVRRVADELGADIDG